MKTRIVTTAYADMKLRQIFYLIRLDSSKNYKSKPSQQLNPTQFIKSSAYHTLHLAHSNYRNFKMSVIHATIIRTFEMNVRTVPSRAQFLPTVLVPRRTHHLIKKTPTQVQIPKLLDLDTVISVIVLPPAIKATAEHRRGYSLLPFSGPVESRTKANILEEESRIQRTPTNTPTHDGSRSHVMIIEMFLVARAWHIYLSRRLYYLKQWGDWLFTQVP